MPTPDLNEEVLILYADVYGFLNFALDFLCLWIGGRIVGRAVAGWRLALGALLGAAYGLLILLPGSLPSPFSIPVPLLLLCHLAALGVMSLTAYGFRSFAQFRKCCFVLLLTETGMGGIVSACYYIGKQRMTAWEVLGTAAVSAVLLALYGRHIRRKVVTKEMKTEIVFGEHRIRCDLLVDSGNLVTEPFSALPVVILSSAVMPEELREPRPETSPVPLRAIPVRTGTGIGLLYGFIPDRVTLCPPSAKRKRVDAVIGIDTECREFGGKDGLLPAALL